MTTYPLVQFVDAPSDDAVVRFDFNTAGDWSDTETWPNHDGWSLGAPTLEGDPDAFGVEWGFRRVTFNLVVKGTKTRAAAVMSQLSRELLRRTNWLRFQLSEFSPPVWLQTYRTESGPLDFDLIMSADDATQDLWGIPVQLDAEPQLFGARRTLAPITIKNDAAAATGNPMWVQLPEIVGDFETPLTLLADVNSTNTAMARRVVNLVMTHSAATPIRVTESVWSSANANTTLPGTSDSQFTDGNAWKLGTVGGGFEKALTGAPVVPYGTYQMVARVGYKNATFANSSDHIWVGHDLDLPIRRPFNLVATAESMSWINLGQITHPFGGAPSAGSAAFPLAVWFERDFGSTACYFDELYLIPVDEDEPGTSALALHGFTGPGQAAGGLYDAETSRVFTLDTANQVVSWFPAPVQTGPLPTVIPGRPNTLFVALGCAMDGKADRANDTFIDAAWTISYHPRWLYLASLDPRDY